MAVGGQRKTDGCTVYCMEQNPSGEASRSSASEEVTFYRTRMFFAVFTRDRHLSLSCY